MASTLGFDRSHREERECFAPALALAGALAALPLLLLIPLADTDRAVSLAFAPAVWLGWRNLRPGRRIDVLLLAWALLAMLVSTVFAGYVARAVVMVAAVAWTIAGAGVAHSIALCLPAVRLVLSGIVAGAVLGVILVINGAAADRMFFPTYWSARLFGGHQFAGCLAVLALVVLTPARRRPLQLLAGVAAVTVWTGLAWSGSRAPALGLGVAIVAWFWRADAGTRRRLLAWTPALALAALALSYPLGAPYPQLGWWHAFTRTVEATGIEAVTSERSHFWTVVWEQIMRSPWIGHGADAYLFIHPNQNGNQPHNVALQWLLEYGVFGAVPLALLVGRTLAGLRPGSSQALPSPEFRTWTGAACAGAAVYALFDGVFYHMIVFMPVAVIVGFALGSRPAGDATQATSPMRTPYRVALLVALAAMLVHNWLQVLLLRAGHVTPESLPARILRAFPSTTHGLQNWTNRWGQTHPELAMDWIKWAQTVATNQATFHAHAAQIYIWEKDFKNAEAEMLRCLEKVHRLERPDVLRVIAMVRRLAAEQSAQAEARQTMPPAQTPAPR